MCVVFGNNVDVGRVRINPSKNLKKIFLSTTLFSVSVHLYFELSTSGGLGRCLKLFLMFTLVFKLNSVWPAISMGQEEYCHWSCTLTLWDQPETLIYSGSFEWFKWHIPKNCNISGLLFHKKIRVKNYLNNKHGREKHILKWWKSVHETLRSPALVMCSGSCFVWWKKYSRLAIP